MSIMATMNGDKIVILNGKIRLLAQLENTGSATIELDGAQVIVELNERNDVVIKPKNHFIH